jgi:hypothetical protein
MEQASTMRLWPLVIALVVWTASPCASIAAETAPAPPATAPSTAVPPSQGSSASEEAHTVYFGVMGEVARPGTYAASSLWNLAQLIKEAGGITSRADKTVRIFRGGVLTEQVFLGSGEALPLLANDLIVVGAASFPAIHTTTASASRESSQKAAASGVQLAFINVIERPVIVKMPADQATLGRIVELLGQPTDCVANIRIFAPPGSGPRELDSIEPATQRLDSGTVLVFAASSIRAESLPALPASIAMRPPAAPVAIVAEPPEFKATQSQVANTKPSDTRHVLVTAELPAFRDTAERLPGDRNLKTLDIAPHIEWDHAGHPAIESAESAQAAVVQPLAAAAPRETHNEIHSGRMVAIMAGMSALAGLAMLLTIVSIVQRWFESGKLHVRRESRTSSTRSPASNGPPSAPIRPIPAGLFRRPIRIDARQPFTRLSVDLAAIERATQSKTNR